MHWYSTPRPVISPARLPHQYYATKRSQPEATTESHQSVLQLDKTKAVARRRPSTQIKTAAAPGPSVSAPAAVPMPVPPTASKPTVRRASATKTSAASGSRVIYPPPQLSVDLSDIKPYLGRKGASQTLPPPKHIIHRLPAGAEATVIRRIASFLDERDAAMLARSCRSLYALLVCVEAGSKETRVIALTIFPQDYSWWNSVYYNVDRDVGGNAPLLWPCFKGWCDNCEIFHSAIKLQAISKARLCAKCIELPEMQDIRISEAKRKSRIGGRMAVALTKLLPYAMMHKTKTKYIWKPHVKWIEDYVYGAEGSAPKNVQNKATSIESLEERGSNEQVEQLQSMRPTKKSIRLKVDASTKKEALDKASSGEFSTSSTIDQQSPRDEANDASYVYDMAAEEEGQAHKRQKRSDADSLPYVGEDFEALRSLYAPSAIRREVRRGSRQRKQRIQLTQTTQ